MRHYIPTNASTSAKQSTTSGNSSLQATSQTGAGILDWKYLAALASDQLDDHI